MSCSKDLPKGKWYLCVSSVPQLARSSCSWCTWRKFVESAKTYRTTQCKRRRTVILVRLHSSHTVLRLHYGNFILAATVGPCADLLSLRKASPGLEDQCGAWKTRIIGLRITDYTQEVGGTCADAGSGYTLKR